MGLPHWAETKEEKEEIIMPKKRKKKMKYAVFGRDHKLIGRSKTLRAANRNFKKKRAGILAKIKPSSKTFSGYEIEKVLKRK